MNNGMEGNLRFDRGECLSMLDGGERARNDVDNGGC